MNAVAIHVVGFNAWGQDQFLVNLQITWVATSGNIISHGVDLPVPVTALAEEVNAAIREKGLQVATANGLVLGPTDIVRVMGGAVPNVS